MPFSVMSLFSNKFLDLRLYFFRALPLQRGLEILLAIPQPLVAKYLRPIQAIVLAGFSPEAHFMALVIPLVVGLDLRLVCFLIGFAFYPQSVFVALTPFLVPPFFGFRVRHYLILKEATASRISLSEVCKYLEVVWMLECPARACTVAAEAPA